MICEILCVGTEILLGDIINTDAAFIARELASLGFASYHQSVVGDNPARLRAAIDE
ncbi:MAG: competence/damage-inducible protein A, partial [Clostridia bacterium]|nr:competence/damage-inducible protein A [Clostridia bacterium]